MLLLFSGKEFPYLSSQQKLTSCQMREGSSSSAFTHFLCLQETGKENGKVSYLYLVLKFDVSNQIPTFMFNLGMALRFMNFLNWHSNLNLKIILSLSTMCMCKCVYVCICDILNFGIFSCALLSASPTQF